MSKQKLAKLAKKYNIKIEDDGYEIILSAPPGFKFEADLTMFVYSPWDGETRQDLINRAIKDVEFYGPKLQREIDKFLEKFLENMVALTKTLPTTLQGFFDIAWQWASRDGFKLCKSNDPDHNICLYRNKEDRNACLIGAAIPDNLYHIFLEDSNIEDVIDNNLLSSINKDLKDSLLELQKCHDHAINEKDCIDRLKDFAETHELTFPDIK